MRTIPDKFYDTLDQLEQDAMLVFVEADLSRISNIAEIYRFYSGPNEMKNSVVWQGNNYDPYPTMIDGISFHSKKNNGRPTLSMSNITGMITGLIIDYNDLVGATINLKIVSAKFLDSENFANGNPDADPNQQAEIRYIVTKLNQLDEKVATFELSLPGDAQNVMIPARTINPSSCIWEYKGDGCGYIPGNMFDYRDNEVFIADLDVCGRRKKSCELRFGKGSSVHHSAFFSVDKVS